MPLNTEEDWVRFSEHLREIDGVVGPFSKAHGYNLPPWPMNGRYPSRKMFKLDGKVRTSIEVVMEQGPNGKNFEDFYPEIPYSVCGSVWVDDPEAHLRWAAPGICACPVPFTTLVQTIPLYLDHMHRYISSFDEATVRAFCRTSRLSP